MPTTKIFTRKNVGGLINYVEKDKIAMEEARRKERYVMASSYLSRPDNIRTAFHQTLEKHKKTKNYVQAQHIIQSFSTDELNGFNADGQHNFEDIQKCNDIGLETAMRLFPKNQAYIVTHLDGEGQKLHNHIIILNVEKESGRSIRSGTHFNHIADISDEVAKAHGVMDQDAKSKKQLLEENGSTDTKTISIREMRKADKYVWKDDLKNRLIDALEKPDTTDFDALETALHQQQVSMKYLKKDGTDLQNITYTFKDAEGKERKCRANKLFDTDDDKKFITHDDLREQFKVNSTDYSIATHEREMKSDFESAMRRWKQQEKINQDNKMSRFLKADIAPFHQQMLNTAINLSEALVLSNPKENLRETGPLKEMDDVLFKRNRSRRIKEIEAELVANPPLPNADKDNDWRLAALALNQSVIRHMDDREREKQEAEEEAELKRQKQAKEALQAKEKLKLEETAKSALKAKESVFTEISEPVKPNQVPADVRRQHLINRTSQQANTEVVKPSPQKKPKPKGKDNDLER